MGVEPHYVDRNTKRYGKWQLSGSFVYDRFLLRRGGAGRAGFFAAVEFRSSDARKHFRWPSPFRSIPSDSLARAVLEEARDALARYRNTLCYGRFRELAMRGGGTGDSNVFVTVKKGRDIG